MKTLKPMVLLFFAAFIGVNSGCKKNETVLITPYNGVYEFFTRYKLDSWWAFQGPDTLTMDTVVLKGNVWQRDPNTKEQNLDALMVSKLSDTLRVEVNVANPDIIKISELKQNNSAVIRYEDIDKYVPADSNIASIQIHTNETFLIPNVAAIRGNILQVKLKNSPLKEFWLVPQFGIVRKIYEQNGQLVTYNLVGCSNCSF